MRIVKESLARPRAVHATARRHEISRAMFTRWRKEYRQGMLSENPAAFTALQIAPDPRPPSGAAGSETKAAERVEITLGNGRRLSVSALIDSTALARLVRVLERA